MWVFEYFSTPEIIRKFIFGKRFEEFLQALISRKIKVGEKLSNAYPNCEVEIGSQIKETYLVSVRIIFLEVEKSVDNRVHHGVGTCEKEKSFLYCLIQIMKGFFIYEKPETKRKRYYIIQNVRAIIHKNTIYARL